MQERLENIEIPQADKPTSDDLNRLKECNSANLYYGLGIMKNEIEARKCALIEKDYSPLGGPAVVMQVYANGQGVTRNFDIATRMACQSGGAPAEIERRLAHLSRMREAYESGQCENGKEKSADCAPITICDDITSGDMQGWCTSFMDDLKAQPEEQAVEAMIARWPVTHQEAFERLQKAASAYITAHANDEVNTAYIARMAFVSTHAHHYLRLFRSDIRQAESGKWPGAQPAFAETDRNLNKTYRKVLADNERFGTYAGAVTPQQVRETQRLWLSYRDTFVAFMKLHHPNISAEAVMSALSRERIKTLNDIPEIAP